MADTLPVCLLLGAGIKLTFLCRATQVQKNVALVDLGVLDEVFLTQEHIVPIRRLEHLARANRANVEGRVSVDHFGVLVIERVVLDVL